MQIEIIVEDGPEHYRIRRGKKVRIPDEWLHKVPHRQTVHKRPSKGLRKNRKRAKYQAGYGSNMSPLDRRAPSADEWE